MNFRNSLKHCFASGYVTLSPVFQELNTFQCLTQVARIIVLHPLSSCAFISWLVPLVLPHLCLRLFWSCTIFTHDHRFFKSLTPSLQNSLSLFDCPIEQKTFLLISSEYVTISPGSADNYVQIISSVVMERVEPTRRIGFKWMKGNGPPFTFLFSWQSS